MVASILMAIGLFAIMYSAISRYHEQRRQRRIQRQWHQEMERMMEQRRLRWDAAIEEELQRYFPPQQ